MSVPEKPYTRKEAYLNAAATGDTSGIPETPYTREEMYLDAIAKKGGGGGGGGSSTLSGLTDVDISNPTDGQMLVYNATSGKWENGEGSGGGSSGFLVVGFSDPEATTLDKTWKEIYESGYAVIRITMSVDTVSWATVTSVYIEGHNYAVGAYDGDYFTLVTDNENGYPVYTETTP